MNDTADLYSEILLEEARQPQHYGQLPEADLTIKGTNPSCGDSLTIYLKLTADKQHIAELKWEGQGCIMSQAAMSVLAGQILSNQLTDPAIISQLKLEDVLELLGLSEISPGRIKCVMLGLGSLQKEITKFQKQI